jgi:hypothetical protein
VVRKPMPPADPTAVVKTAVRPKTQAEKKK